MESLEDHIITEAVPEFPESSPLEAENAVLRDLRMVSTSTVAETPPSEEDLLASCTVYEAYRDSHDEAVKIGLYGEDLQAVLRDPHTVTAQYAGPEGRELQMPLLVPADQLKWYNMDLLRTTYGYGKEYLYYAHPPIPEGSEAVAADTITTKLAEGAVIFTDQYLGDTDSAVLEEIANQGDPRVKIENIGGGDVQRTGEVFVGPTTFKGAGEIKEAPSIGAVYRQMVASGELEENSQDGVSLSEVISGDEAERIWEIYKEPFDDLSKEHPMYAGFAKEELMDILADPEIAKIVNKVDGEISTLCFFVNDFDHCPWFNKQFYQENYPEYYDTKNVVIFPGIVTDPRMRGNDYAMKVLDVATKLYSRRGSDILVTFECTETSAVYIPTITEMAISHAGEGTITGIGEPISVTQYKAIKKDR